jgi:hypothetical protein
VDAVVVADAAGIAIVVAVARAAATRPQLPAPKVAKASPPVKASLRVNRRVNLGAKALPPKVARATRVANRKATDRTVVAKAASAAVVVVVEAVVVVAAVAIVATATRAAKDPVRVADRATVPVATVVAQATALPRSHPAPKVVMPSPRTCSVHSTAPHFVV